MSELFGKYLEELRQLSIDKLKIKEKNCEEEIKGLYEELEQKNIDYKRVIDIRNDDLPNAFNNLMCISQVIHEKKDECSKTEKNTSIK